MATKKINISELGQQCLEAEKNFKALSKQLEAAKKEEEEAKKAKLEAEMQERHDEVVRAYKKFLDLKDAFVNDYGYFYSKYTLWV